MPHGSIRVGDVEIVALCDAVVTFDPIEASYPRVPDDVWPRIRADHPETIDPTGRWLLHVHCFVVRAEGRTVLFDTGVGPATAPAFGWTGVEGALLEQLAGLGVGVDDVDDVLISHVHDDHLGWATTVDARPRFPRARYVVNRADRDALRDGVVEDTDVYRRTLAPLEEAGVVELSEERLRLGVTLELVRAPGHTPGHQVLVVDDGDARAIVSADTTNHPALVEEPSWSGTSDADPDRAATTRAELLELAERDARIWIPSHLADPFGRIVTEDGRRTYRPL